MKNHHHNGPVVSQSANSRGVIHEAIATRAYALWEQHGRPEGQAEAHWLQAEIEQVTGRRTPEPEKLLAVSF